MDLDVAGAIESLTDRVDASDRSMRSVVEGLRSELRVLGERTINQFDGVRAEFTGVREDLRRLAERVEDNRRHAEILTESVRDDIRMVAEGVASLAAKLDAR